MEIILAIISILAIAGVVFGANKILQIRICPICAGVASTWLLMLVLRFAGYPISVSVLAILIGGSVVGIAYQLEKRLSAGRSAILFKMLFLPAGFVAAYGIVGENWVLASAAIAGLSLATAVFFSHGQDDKPGDLEKKLKDCC